MFKTMSAGGATFINSPALYITLLMGILMLILPRKYAIVPIIIITCYITLGTRLVIATLDFTMLRILIIFGWVRLIIHNEIKIKINIIDKIFICWIISSIVTYTLLYGTIGAFINRMGLAFNAIGIYFMFRSLIRDLNDIIRIIKIISIMIIPLTIAILFEFRTGKNVFAIFGGVAEITEIRNGRFRCQGSFAHPILIGTFGATLMPLLTALWWQKGQNKVLTLIGATCATIITYASASSGPLIAYISGIIGLAMWPIKNKIRYIKLFILIILILLHFIIMKAPVWYLIARISEFIGGTGWHRSELINQAIKHFNEWWLIGTKSTDHWMPFGSLSINPNMIDMTNQYIKIGVDGGVITLLLFILIIQRCFKSIGKIINKKEDQILKNNILLWSLGVTLFVHVISFISVSYFDQIIVFWYLLLASISSLNVKQLNNLK